MNPISDQKAYLNSKIPNNPTKLHKSESKKKEILANNQIDYYIINKYVKK